MQWRKCPASVHSTNATWQTSFGLTQRHCSIFSAVNDSPHREDLFSGRFLKGHWVICCALVLQAPSGEVLEAVGKLGLEGVVGKRINSTYESGERSGAWIKHRTNREQEFVTGGYVGAHGFDALLVRRLREETAHLRGQGEERLRAANSG